MQYSNVTLSKNVEFENSIQIHAKTSFSHQNDSDCRGTRGKMALLRILLCISLSKSLYTDVLMAIDASTSYSWKTIRSRHIKNINEQNEIWKLTLKVVNMYCAGKMVSLWGKTTINQLSKHTKTKRQNQPQHLTLGFSLALTTLNLTLASW